MSPKDQQQSSPPESGQTQMPPPYESVTPQQPAPAPPAQSNPYSPEPSVAVPVANEPVNAGLIILQWLTYAFWGWTVLALSVLTVTVISSFVSDADTEGFTPYGIAAVLVLLPISYICDSFYSKREPSKKTGAEVWVMVIHAVIFALFGIGALIGAVISLVLLATDSSGSKTSQVSLYSALIITVFYALTFLRTLNPPKIRSLQRSYKMIMILSVGLIALLGVVGPLAKERTTRDDKLIVAEITNVSDAIDNYATANKKLPENLGMLDLKGDAKQLVDKKLVEYKPEQSTDPTPLSTRVLDTNSLSDSSFNTSSKTYRYQLCATYTKESNDYSGYEDTINNSADTDGYSTYLSVYDHPAGTKCYKLKTGQDY